MFRRFYSPAALNGISTWNCRFPTASIQFAAKTADGYSLSSTILHFKHEIIWKSSVFFYNSLSFSIWFWFLFVCFTLQIYKLTNWNRKMINKCIQIDLKIKRSCVSSMAKKWNCFTAAFHAKNTVRFNQIEFETLHTHLAIIYFYANKNIVYC